MTPFEHLEEAWRLCDATREYVQKAGREIPMEETLEKIILISPLVDIDRTKREAGTKTPTRVFLKSPYGVEYRPNVKNWIPFRHGPV
jgi:hypothetical protein